MQRIRTLQHLPDGIHISRTLRNPQLLLVTCVNTTSIRTELNSRVVTHRKNKTKHIIYVLDNVDSEFLPYKIMGKQ